MASNILYWFFTFLGVFYILSTILVNAFSGIVTVDESCNVPSLALRQDDVISFGTFLTDFSDFIKPLIGFLTFKLNYDCDTPTEVLWVIGALNTLILSLMVISVIYLIRGVS